jgi:hypothetical protein
MRLGSGKRSDQGAIHAQLAGSASYPDLAFICTEVVQFCCCEKLGEHPAVLCALAGAVFGPWAQRGQLAPE